MEKKKRNMYLQNQKLKSVMGKKDIFDEETGHVLREVNGTLVELKYCPHCKQWRPLDDFYKVKYGRDKLMSNCKECDKNKYYAQGGGNKVETIRTLRDKALPGDRFDDKTGHVFRMVDGVETELKYCKTCKIWHPLSYFQRDATSRDGLRSRCRGYQLEQKVEAKVETMPVQPVVEEAKSIEQLLEALKSEVTKVQAQKKDLSNLTEKEVKEVLENNQVPPRILFEAIARQCQDRFIFYAYDKELGMTIPIKTKEETQAYVMGA